MPDDAIDQEASVFRQHALKRQFYSPEQLDEVIDVTRPRDWLVLSAIWLVLAFSLFWGFAGSLPSRVSGEGMLLGDGEVVDVEASGPGRIGEVLVSVGETVTGGQIIARIDRTELATRKATTEAGIRELQADREKLIADHQREKTLKEQNAAAQRERLRERIVIARARAAALEDDVSKMRDLLAKGFATTSTLRQREGELNSELFRIADAKAQIEALEAAAVDLALRQERELQALEHEITEASASLAELQAVLARDQYLKAPAAGRVLEVIMTTGTVVNVGTKVARIETSEGGLRAAVFLSEEQAKNISEGMKVNITPATVRREESGTLVGTVTRAPNFPITPESMSTLLRNDMLVRRFSAAAPTYLVEIGLETDPRAAGRYRWTSKNGPDQKLSPGTLLVADITVKEQRPVELVVPALKKFVGLDQ